MSRQIQIRRGNANEHKNFIGAVGEISMDLDAKTLRVHDGQTAGGIALARADQVANAIPDSYDFVIESGASATDWYRKYKSGWIEQGGFSSVNANNHVEFILKHPMKDAAYYANAVLTSPFGIWTNRVVAISKNTTKLTVSNVGGSNAMGIMWEIKGLGI